MPAPYPNLDVPTAQVVSEKVDCIHVAEMELEDVYFHFIRPALPAAPSATAPVSSEKLDV
jgi:hypothetical protein